MHTVGSEVAVLFADHIGGDDGDDLFQSQKSFCSYRQRRTYGVPKPVGGGGQTNSTGTDGKGEDFSNDDPRGRSPSGGKARNG